MYRKMPRRHSVRTQSKTLGLRTFRADVPCKNGHIAERFTASGRCVVCVDERAHARRAANIARAARRAANKDQRDKQARARNDSLVWKTHRLVVSSRARAKKAGVPHTIVDADIAIPEFCPALGIRLVSKRHKQGPLPTSPTLDRIVPKLGYVPGNVFVISHKANTMKSYGTLEDLKALVAWLENILMSADERSHKLPESC